MSTLLTIFGTLVCVVILILLVAFAHIGIHFLTFFYWRNCNYCGHRMKYRGVKEYPKGDCYIFYCPKCGAWEEISKHEFTKSICEDEYRP